MKLSRQCEIAIDILVYCARHPGMLVRTRDAADYARTTNEYAHQIVKRLVRCELLVGMRGRPGGIRLAMQADSILVGDVVRLMEPSLRNIGDPAGAGPFRELVSQAYRAGFRTLDEFSIADLC